jgi:glutamate--cysteine ligase
VSLILGNKWVTKQILEEQKIKVPRGYLFANEPDARTAYGQFSSGRWVVKPKTTNFGIGITLLPESAPQSYFEAAFRDAFRHDTTVVVEEFIEGPEYRFLVIDDEVEAVLNRVPANVIGDGKNTIRELVDIKNEDPRRGKGYRTPLERIELGDVELDVLRTAGMGVDSVPDQNVQVFLRENSNISTGGDSIDQTDEMDERYKKVAVNAARAAGARICGVDMIVGEHDYGIIELNFNPVLYFHDFPYEGENRHTGRAVLDALGF